MNTLSFEEKTLICIYNISGNRPSVIAELEKMRAYLAPNETELLNLTDNTLAKLRIMSDEEYDALDLFPDFDQEAVANGK